MKLIAITGGIGSGKSVVSRVLNVMGYSVYDCDSEAKRIMNNSAVIKDALVEAFGREAVDVQGRIVSSYIGKIVFNDKPSLLLLNSIVHPVIRQDVLDWVKNKGKGYVFVETAILHESSLNEIVGDEWNVYAPDVVRVERVMQRNNMKKNEVLVRIKSQARNDTFTKSTIINDNTRAILPQIIRNLDILNKSE